MFKINVESQLPKALEKLKAVDKAAWPGILAEASNETGFYVLAKFKQQLPQYIDRPTPFTLNSMFVKKASRSNPDASVQWKDWTGSGSVPAGKYLQPEVHGGPRRPKRFERALQASGLMPQGYVAVPTKDAPRDAYGNVPGGFITQVLSYLKANPDFMQNRQVNRLKKMGTGKLLKGVFKTATNYEKVKAREERARKKKPKFFSSIQGQNNNPLPSGVYERVDMAMGSAIRRIFSYVPVATYRVSIPFYDIGKQAADKKFPEKLDQAIQKSLAKK